ncbi:hypothetical protein [Amycolatopsis sp. NPDC051128]|uniref:hypothetical protein n=1 Tax=Amycolatopsis sp. NPDC051128 TaxID=3155412 RepID=UPI00342A6933
MSEKMIGSASAGKCAARAAAAVKAVRLTRGALPENPSFVIPPRYRFDFKHITKTNIQEDYPPFGSVAVTLYSDGPFARAAIVDA